MAASEKRRRRGGSARQRSWQQRRGLGPPRDFLGYGADPPRSRWPGDARIAINLNLNFEAGGEHSILEGDRRSRKTCSTILAFRRMSGMRSPIVESVFEYGPRVGCWRLLRIFKRFDVKVEHSRRGTRPAACIPNDARVRRRTGTRSSATAGAGSTITPWARRRSASISGSAIAEIKKLTGEPPVGWFDGRPSINTRRLLVEPGGFLYDRDCLNDELPYWVTVVGTRNHLVIPYSLETNDNRFDQNSGFCTADDFARYMIDCFDLLYAEGAERPKLMSWRCTTG